MRGEQSQGRRAGANAGVGQTLAGGRVEAFGASVPPLPSFSALGPPEVELAWVAPNGKAHAHAELTLETLFGQTYLAGTGSFLFFPGSHTKMSETTRNGPFKPSRFGLGAAATLRPHTNRSFGLRASSMFHWPSDEASSKGSWSGVSGVDRWLLGSINREGDISVGFTVDTNRAGQLQIPIVGTKIDLEASKFVANLTVATGWSLQGIQPANASIGILYSIDV